METEKESSKVLENPRPKNHHWTKKACEKQVVFEGGGIVPKSVCEQGIKRGTHPLIGATCCEGTLVLAVILCGVCTTPWMVCECSGSSFSPNKSCCWLNLSGTTYMADFAQSSKDVQGASSTSTKLSMLRKALLYDNKTDFKSAGKATYRSAPRPVYNTMHRAANRLLLTYLLKYNFDLFLQRATGRL